MRERELFIKALDCLFWSFGSEPPAEVIWGANDLLIWFETEYVVSLCQRFEEENIGESYEKVIEAIRNTNTNTLIK
jgi:hypothetical protein